MKQLFFLGLSATLCVPAYAGWVEVGKTSTSIFYVDPGSYQRTESIVRMNYLVDFSASSARKSFASSIDTAEFDCSDGRYRLLGFVEYSGSMATGEISLSHDKAADWEGIIPNSVSHLLWKTACFGPPNSER